MLQMHSTVEGGGKTVYIAAVKGRCAPGTVKVTSGTVYAQQRRSSMAEHRTLMCHNVRAKMGGGEETPLEARSASPARYLSRARAGCGKSGGPR